MRQAGRLAGKSALVTGAGSRGDGIGNGRATAILFAREGARLTILDQNPDWLQETVRLVEQDGNECRPVVADVTDEDACGRAVESAVSAYGTVDVLVNNVGILGPEGTAREVDSQAWDDALRVNVTSMMLMAKYVLPHMERAAGGAIVNIASVAGLVGGHPSLLYPTSKGAVVNMTRAMAAHHGPHGIRVNCVAPGMVYTPMMTSRGMSEEQREARRRRSPLGSEGTAWDVANAVLFLASDDARWVTGAILPVDAGATASMGGLPVP